MQYLKAHRPVAAHATALSDADPTHRFKAKIEIRRKLDHWPIPKFEHFTHKLFPRLPNDDFAHRYGASDEDLELVHQHYSAHGLTTNKHNARRHVEIEGTVEQHNAAFNTKMRNWTKRHGDQDVEFIAPGSQPMVPDHLEDIILCVHGLGNEPHALPRTVPTPVIPTAGVGTGHLTAAQLMTLYKTPTNLATGQVICIPVTTQSFGLFSQADLNATCTAAGFTAPTVTTIINDVFTQGAGAELQLDCSMCALFGRGAALYIYQFSAFEDLLARVVAPEAGDPNVTIISYSAGGPEYSTISLAWEDCAIQGVTILEGSGDWGSSPNPVLTPGFAVQATDATNPWICAVGETIIGNISQPLTSSSTFDEWMAQDGGNYNISGGGVSCLNLRPSYQSSVTIPANVSTTPSQLGAGLGRAIPDISANGSVFSAITYISGGVTFSSGGTSQATPIMAGIFARINAALGANMGFINPTLYAVGSGSASIRDINTGGTGGTFNGNFYGNNEAGYNVTTGWDACTGLGVVNGTAFLAYLQAHSETVVSFKQSYVRIVSANANGTSETVVGPFPTPVTY